MTVKQLKQMLNKIPEESDNTEISIEWNTLDCTHYGDILSIDYEIDEYIIKSSIEVNTSLGIA